MTKRDRLVAASVSAVLALSGCATTGPDDALEDIDVPTAFSADPAVAAPRPLTNDWVADLGDDGAADIILQAIERNRDLATAAARVRATRERVGITRAELLPGVGAGLRATSTSTPGGEPLFDSGGNPITDGAGNPILSSQSSTEQYSLGFNLSWELDIWGRITDQTRAAYLDAAAAELTYQSTALSIAGAAAQAWYGLTEARLQRQLSERDVETGEANLRIIERRYNRGVASSLDVRLARSSLASSRATLIARQQAEAESARRLEVLIGRYPAAAITPPEALPQLAPLAGGGGAVGTPETLLFRRPDIVAAERQLKAAGLRVSAARKALIPSLSISGSSGQSARSFEDITYNYDDAVNQMIASLVQPLFQGGRLRAQVLAAKAEKEAAVATYAQTALTAFEEVENALAAERLLAAREEAQRLAFDEAVAAEDLTTRQYLSGTADIFNLINAQQRRISSESQYIAAARARLSNRINLYLALGAPFLTEVTPERAAQATGPEAAAL